MSSGMAVAVLVAVAVPKATTAGGVSAGNRGLGLSPS